MSEPKPEYEVNSGMILTPLIGSVFEYMQVDRDFGADVDTLNKLGAEGWQVVRWYNVEKVNLGLPPYEASTSQHMTRYILMRVKP